MIRAVCSLIVVVLTTIIQASDYDVLISPCPDVFKYNVDTENHQPLSKKWYGIVTLSTNVTLHALWLNVILDRKADILGSWIGEVTTKDHSNFMIENPNITLLEGQSRTVSFFVQYSSNFKPKLKAIFLNGRELCNANKTEVKVDSLDSSLINNYENNKTFVKSTERSPTVATTENINYKSQTKNKIIQTTTPKPYHYTSTTTKRPETTLGMKKNGNTAQLISVISNLKTKDQMPMAPETKTQLYYINKSDNNQGIIISTENSNQPTIFKKVTTYSKINDENTKGNNLLIGSTVTNQQLDSKDRKNSQQLRPDDNSRFDSIHRIENAFATIDVSTLTKTKNDESSKTKYTHETVFRDNSGSPQTYTATPWSPGQSEIGDRFTESSSDNAHEERDCFKDQQLTVKPFSPAVTEDEEDDTHADGDLPIFLPTFNLQPSCGKVVKKPPEYLPYGSSTSEGQWPWQVAIYQQQTVDLKYICGGTLVSQRHILTAAHCVTRKKSISIVQPKTLTVYLGKFNLRLSVEGVQIKFVSGIRVHPQYNSTNFSHDLAILEMLDPAVITEWVRPVCLWPEEEISLSNIIGRSGSVVGWNFEDTGLTNAELRLMEMPITDLETCINSFDSFYDKFASEYTYCARYKQGTETCNGNDSGGGMVLKKGDIWYLRGIVSVSIALQNERRCDSKHYIIFTDVAKVLPWIRDYIDL